MALDGPPRAGFEASQVARGRPRLEEDLEPGFVELLRATKVVDETLRVAKITLYVLFTSKVSGKETHQEAARHPSICGVVCKACMAQLLRKYPRDGVSDLPGWS